MAASQTSVVRRRRVRRRRQDKPAVSARLVLDDHIKTDVGIISEDLFAELFPHLADSRDQPDAAPQTPLPLHIAIAPWTPTNAPDSATWSIVPVTLSSALAPSTVQFSPSSLALQSFAHTLKQVAPSQLSTRSRSGIDISVLDVTAIELDTVFVSLEGDLAKRLENGEGVFFRERPDSNKPKAPAAAPTPEARLTAALRAALSTLKVVHTGDLFPLPLPPHPVTHVPPNPGKITLCEPVAQGILGPNTKIIVSRGRGYSKHDRSSTPIGTGRGVEGDEGDEGEDTANDQFYSAAEDRARTDTANDTDGSQTDSDDQVDGVNNDDDSLSDGSDDIITLQTPPLSSTITSGIGTPSTIGRGRKTNGVVSGAASVFSSWTASTARPDRPRGRLFKAHGLAQPIPPELLHPKPAPEDDEEARIYVDTRDLNRIGCFSGDWVRVEAAQEPPAHGFGALGLGSFEQDPDEEVAWRPARVYGLPEAYASRPMARVPSSKYSSDGRRMSFFEAQVQKPSSPVVYLSPIMLANLDSPPYLRLSPIKRPAQAPGAAVRAASGSQAKSSSAPALQPPFAREVILQHVRTPIPVERDVQTAVMAGLKFYFERRLRLVKAGDLIAVPIDTQLGRTLQESTAAEEPAVDDVLGLIASSNVGSVRPEKSAKYDEVAWFKVAHVTPVKQDLPEGQQEEEEDPWNGAARVDISIAHLEQSGSVTSRVPGTMSSNWPWYLGIKKLPKQQPSQQARSPTMLVEPERPYISPLRRKLRELMAAATSKPAIHLKMPPVAILLVSTQRAIGKATTATQACMDIGLHTFTIDAYDIVNDVGGGPGGGGDVKTAGFLTSRAERAMSCGPDCCALLIRHIEALTADRMVQSMKEILADARVLIATTTEVDKVPDGIRALFTHELEMSAPDEAEREGILKSVVDERGLTLDPEVDLSSVALKTAALVAGDLVDVVERACVAQRSRLEKLSASKSSSNNPNQPAQPVTVRDVQVAGGPAAIGLTKADFDVAVDAARKNFADAIGAPKIPNVTWDDVGGLNNVKDAITETIQLPLERPELFAKGMKKRSGILFYGPPGTGKTLLAKAIATEYSLNFFSVKGPELLNMYIGESEANVRRVFQRARDARPCVVFFDELDSVAPKRGNQGDSGGVMDRIVSQLLAELDGMSSGEDGSGGVFVIGATNRPDLLDPALLRPGRFDKMLYLGVSDTHEKQLKILEALTRKFTLHPSVSLPAIAERLPFTYTGADFYALCSDAMLKAVTRQAAAVDAKVRSINASRAAQGQPPISTAYFFDHHATQDDIAVTVTEQDFLDAQRELVPSVSAGELEHYERVRRAFEQGEKEKGKQQQQQQQQQEEEEEEDEEKKKKKKKKELKEGITIDLGAINGGVSSSSSVPRLVLPTNPAAASAKSGGSPTSEKSTGSVKGKGKAVPPAVLAIRDKGKGKAAASSSSLGSDDEEDEVGTEYTDADSDYYRNMGVVKGQDKGKGKGKEVVPPIEVGNGAPFQDGAAGGDDELYDLM